MYASLSSVIAACGVAFMVAWFHSAIGWRILAAVVGGI
jgi:hypothetical protein